MIKWLTLVEPFGVIGSSNYGRISIQEDPLLAVRHKARSVGEVSIVGEELSLIRESTIIVRTDEGIGH